MLSETASSAQVTESAFLRAASERTAAAMPRRRATVLTFVLADMLAFAAVAAGVVGLLAAGTSAFLPVVNVLLPVFVLLVMAFGLSGLYMAVSMHPAQELKRVSIITAVVFAGYTLAVYLVGAADLPIVSWLLIAWGLSMVLVPSSRALCRVLFSRMKWWGIPVLIVASKHGGYSVVETLQRWPELGFKPVAVLQEDVSAGTVKGVPVLGTAELVPDVAEQYRIPHSILSMPDLTHRELVDCIGRYSKFFDRVSVIPSGIGAPALWTSTSSFEGLMGYEVQHADRKRQARLIKRLFDLIGAMAILVVIAPMMAVIAVLIKMDTPGPVFFRQTRMGKDGSYFELLKFRTMYADAEERLEQLLASNEALRREYETYHKLRNDPRVTDVGRILRRYSLDELPQLFNVILGHMSLVGPRAYVPDEIGKMDGLEHIILQNDPGITGLWQVSGRNELSFEERVQTDVHYVHNWTPWLDLYIMARTLPVVVTGEGAH